MLNFVRKSEIWDAYEKGYPDELKSNKISYQLKTAQDLSIYRIIRDLKNLDIGEIGGGNSRILERLALNNRCSNIEKFEGQNLGPKGEIILEKIKNIDCYVGESEGAINDEEFDLIFSISVVEHVTNDKLDLFFKDSLRILRPGGIFYHAIDMYLEDIPSSYQCERFDIYKNWVKDSELVTPVGNVLSGAPEFSTDMATNPDNIMHGWNSLVPSLSKIRASAQSVSLLIGGMKK